eukprot:scaffold250750_cov30-Tisochrysis_lutea.AAC.2
MPPLSIPPPIGPPKRGGGPGPKLGPTPSGGYPKDRRGCCGMGQSGRGPISRAPFPMPPRYPPSGSPCIGQGPGPPTPHEPGPS